MQLLSSRVPRFRPRQHTRLWKLSIMWAQVFRPDYVFLRRQRSNGLFQRFALILSSIDYIETIAKTFLLMRTRSRSWVLGPWDGSGS